MYIHVLIHVNFITMYMYIYNSWQPCFDVVYCIFVLSFLFRNRITRSNVASSESAPNVTISGYVYFWATNLCSCSSKYIRYYGRVYMYIEWGRIWNQVNTYVHVHVHMYETTFSDFLNCQAIFTKHCNWRATETLRNLRTLCSSAHFFVIYLSLLVIL